MITDPPPIGFTTLSEEKKWHVTCDTWRVTYDTLHMTRDTWHVICLGGWIFSQNFSFIALTVCDLWYYEDLEEKAHWISQLINHKAVYRTAPATPGLLIKEKPLIQSQNPELIICFHKMFKILHYEYHIPICEYSTQFKIFFWQLFNDVVSKPGIASGSFTSTVVIRYLTTWFGTGPLQLLVVFLPSGGEPSGSVCYQPDYAIYFHFFALEPLSI